MNPKIRFLFFFLWLAPNAFLFSQQDDVGIPDSLWRALLDAPDSLSFEAARLTGAFCSKKSDDPEACFRNVLEVLEEKKLYPACFNMLENFYWHLRSSLQYDLALQYLKKGLSLAEKQEIWKEERRFAMLLGQYYSRKPNYDSAFYFLKKYEWISTLHRAEKSWTFYRLQAILFQDLEEFEKAALAFRDMYKQGKREIGNRAQYGYMLHLVSSFFYKRDSLEAFARFYDEYLLFLKEGNPDFLEDPLHYGRLFIGDSLDTDKMERALSFHLKNGYSNGAFVMMILLAEQYNKNKQYSKSVALLQAGKTLSDSIEFHTNQEQYHLSLIEAYKGLGKQQKALAVAEKWLLTQKENFTKEIARNISRWEVKYETQKKESALLQKQLELNRNRLQKQSLLGLLFFLGASAVMVYLHARRRLLWERKVHRQQSLLKKQRIRELQAENRQLAMSKLIEGQEHERRHIARELHDGLGSLFSALRAYVNTFEERIISGRDRKNYQKIIELLRMAGEELRRITHRMSPAALSKTSLVESIQDLVHQLEKSGLSPSLEFIGLQEDLPNSLKVNLYRIIQELTNNIVKHAGAKNVLIQLMQVQKQMVLLVEDDGCGFNYAEALQQNTLGLQGVQARVHLLGGKMEVFSQEGKGCSVEINIPLNKAEARNKQTFGFNSPLEPS